MEQTTTSNESTITDWKVALRQAKRVEVLAACGDGDSVCIPVTKKVAKMIKEHALADTADRNTYDLEYCAVWNYHRGVLTITLYT